MRPINRGGGFGRRSGGHKRPGRPNGAVAGGPVNPRNGHHHRNGLYRPKPPHPAFVPPPPRAENWLHPRRPVPLGLLFHFYRRAELIEARSILLRIRDGKPISLEETFFLQRVFGRLIENPHDADLLICYLDEEIPFF